MNRFESVTKPLRWFMALLLVAFVAGCGGGSDPILGGGGGGTAKQSTVTDTTKPRVTFTVPADLAPSVPINAAITATFTEAMLSGTITAAGTFTVMNTTTSAVEAATTMTYDAASKTAIFKHAALTPGNKYTATITTAATDLAIPANALAGNLAPLPAPSDYVWTFTAAVTADTTQPTVTLTAPIDAAINVARNSTVNATFSEDMDPTTICGTASLTVACPVATFTVVTTLGGTAVAGTMSYAAGSRIATFKPTATLPASTKFTATITTGATDLAGNALNILAGPPAKPLPWTFTTGTGLAPGAVALGSASTYGLMATSAITCVPTCIINGDVSLDPGTSITGPPVINGALHVNDTVSKQARKDLLAAYNNAKGLPPGTGLNALSAGADPGALFPLGVPPGTYTSGSTIIASTPMVLDAGGNANAVWVFQIGSSLTTGASVTLANGAQSKNVFWVPTAAATIGVGTTFEGTILAGGNVTAVSGSTINGRILAGAIGAGTLALQSGTKVNVPAP